MSAAAFFTSTIWPWVFARETDPKDPDKLITDSGGLTKYGVSQRAYPHLDIAGLTRDQARDIYQRDYWRASGADTLPDPWALAVTDSAINMGVPRARSLLVTPGVAELDDFLWERADAYRRIALSNPKELVYLPGWIRRTYLLRHALGAAANLRKGTP